MLNILIESGTITDLDAKTYQEIYPQLHAIRRNKIDRMKFEKDKKLALMGGWLIKRCLESQGCEYAKLDFETNNYGKPIIKQAIRSNGNTQSNIHFNISHSGQRVLCSVSDRPIGCDVEQCKKLHEDIQKDLQMKWSVANRVLHPMELENLKQVQGEVFHEMFYRYWTLKESYIKMIGEGMHLSMDSFCIELPKDMQGEFEQIIQGEKVLFNEWKEEDYQFAYCVRR